MTLSRRVEVTELSWPELGEATDESGLGCNRAYIDLRSLSWTEAKKTLAEEKRLIAQIEEAEAAQDATSSIEEEYDESGSDLFGLGHRSSVNRCCPFRCEMRAIQQLQRRGFGDGHHEIYPVVAFYAKPETANLLLAIATEVDIGIETASYGYLVVFSDDIRKFPIFAEATIRRRKEFNSLRLSPSRTSKASEKPAQSRQYELPF